MRAISNTRTAVAIRGFLKINSSRTPEGYTESANIGEKDTELSEALSSPLGSEETVLHRDLDQGTLVDDSSTNAETELSSCSMIYESVSLSKHTKK